MGGVYELWSRIEGKRGETVVTVEEFLGEMEVLEGDSAPHVPLALRTAVERVQRVFLGYWAVLDGAAELTLHWRKRGGYHVVPDQA